MQLLVLTTLLGAKRHPFNVVLRQHRMLHRADLDVNNAIFHAPDGNVLLDSRVGHTRNDLAHRFTAANNGNTAVLNLDNDIAAMLANIKLLLHDRFSFSF